MMSNLVVQSGKSSVVVRHDPVIGIHQRVSLTGRKFEVCLSDQHEVIEVLEHICLDCGHRGTADSVQLEPCSPISRRFPRRQRGKN